MTTGEKIDALLASVRDVIKVEILSHEVPEFYGDDWRDLEDNGEHFTVNVRVAFADVQKAQERLWSEEGHQKVQLRHGYISVFIKPQTPKLVSANLGDFVIIWCEWKTSEDELPVGVVTSVITSPDGKRRYGCRYIIPADRWTSTSDRVYSISNDNYGGHPAGFYKVISKEEAIARAAREIRQEYKERFERVQEDLDALETDLETAVGCFQHVIKTTSLSAEEIQVKRNDE